MYLDEFLELVEKIKLENQNAGQMEIGPVFWSGGEPVVLTTVDVKVSDNQIGIHWMC